MADRIAAPAAPLRYTRQRIPAEVAPPSRFTTRLVDILQAHTAKHAAVGKDARRTPWKWTFSTLGRRAGDHTITVYTSDPPYLQTEMCDKYVHKYRCHRLEVDVPCCQGRSGHWVIPVNTMIERLMDDHREIANIPVMGEWCPMCLLGSLQKADGGEKKMHIGMGDGEKRVEGLSASVENTKEGDVEMDDELGSADMELDDDEEL